MSSGKHSLALGFVQLPSLLTSRRSSCFFVYHKEFEVYDKLSNLFVDVERSGAQIVAVKMNKLKSEWTWNRLCRTAPITLSHTVITRRSFSTEFSSEVGAIDPDTARAQRKEQRKQAAVKTNADCLLWFYNTFGHWDVEKAYKTPDSETITLEDGRVVFVPEHIRGRDIYAVWRGYLEAASGSRKTKNSIYGIEQYGVSSPSEMRVLIDQHRAREKHKKPEYLILRGFRWYYDTHGDWSIPKTFVIPADASVPEELHGMRVGEKWYGYACLNYYTDWGEEMRSLGIPDRETARQARRPFNMSGQGYARHRERAHQTASGFRWYYDAYGHWVIPAKYQVPDADSIQLANGTTVPVPVELRGLRIGHRWHAYHCKTRYLSFWSEFEQQGVSLPDEANYVLHTTAVKLDAERGSRHDVSMQTNAEAFRWFFDTYGHWDIQHLCTIPEESVVKVHGKEVIVPAHLRGLQIGFRWVKYFHSQSNMSSHQFWTSKYNLPDPQTAKALIKQHRRDLAEGKVEGVWSADNKSLLVALENARAFLDFYRTHGHWRIPLRYRVNDENIGGRWHRYIRKHTYGEYREELALTGLPDPKTAYEMAKQRKTAKMKRRIVPNLVPVE